jgi:outer membrane protein assembly factor BamA
VSVWKPALIVPRTRGTLTLSIARENEEAYSALLTSATGTITQIWSLNTTMRYGLEVSYNDYVLKPGKSADFEEANGLLSAWVFNWNRETARDRLWPLDGTAQSLRLRWAPDYISESQFILAEPNVAFYSKIMGETIVSGRLRLGLGGTLGSTNVLPPNERFYAGGASSHRGFERRRLGPKDASEAPLGGAAKLESAMEVRFPLFRSLFGATFVDAGQVWNEMQAARAKDIEVAAGLGLMVKTIAGPLRIDYAWRLTRQDTTQPYTQFHFSIGNPF